MTKLQEWLSATGVLFAIWFYLITNKSENSFVKDNYILIFYSPIIFVTLFGLYALSIVVYRVYTFNNCVDAAVELQNEITEAKECLIKLGFNFKEKTKSST